MRDLSCTECVALCPEVALGAAEAEDRAAVFAHVERCAACATSLRSMTDVADGLAALVPPVDPPTVLERRVLHAITTGGTPDRRSPFAHRLRSRPLAVAATIAVAVLLCAGSWWVGKATSAPSSVVVTAALTSHGSAVGEVVLVAGAHPWIAITMDVGTAGSVVRCDVRGQRGQIETVGSFTLVGGYGSWATPLPAGLVVRGARVVTRGGRVLASASVPTG